MASEYSLKSGSMEVKSQIINGGFLTVALVDIKGSQTFCYKSMVIPVGESFGFLGKNTPMNFFHNYRNNHIIFNGKTRSIFKYSLLSPVPHL